MTFESELLKALGSAPPLVVLVAVVWLFLRYMTTTRDEAKMSHEQVVNLLHESLAAFRENAKVMEELRGALSDLKDVVRYCGLNHAIIAPTEGASHGDPR